MRLVFLRPGTRFEIWAIDLASRGEDVDCPARQFLEQLERDAPVDFNAMPALLKMHAQAGPILNKQKSRMLEDGISEFKTRNGSRLLWFYASGRRTVLTHGFRKGAPLARELERAKRYLDELKEELK